MTILLCLERDVHAAPSKCSSQVAMCFVGRCVCVWGGVPVCVHVYVVYLSHCHKVKRY